MQEDHYYPFGMKQEGSWTPTTDVKNRYQYNGIEHSEDLGLNVNFAFYRTLDPSLGRWWGVDPAAESFKGLNPYNSMFNNPISYTDPEGDAAWAVSGAISSAINVAGYLLTHTGDNFSWGGLGLAAANGFINGALFGSPFGNKGLLTNPIAPAATGFGSLRIDITGGVGTDGAGIGIDLTLGIGVPKTGINIAEFSGGLSLKSSFIGSKGFGIEGRLSFGYGVTSNGYGFTAGVNVYGDNVGTSQTTGFFKIGLGKDRYLLYENDWNKYSPPLGDGEDRWRTAGLRLKWGKFSAGFNLFTGDPYGPANGQLRPNGLVNGQPTYTGGTADKYRAGIFYIGLGRQRMGWNGEGLRAGVQNGIHNLTGDPHFLRKRGYPYELPYYFYGESNNYSVW